MDLQRRKRRGGAAIGKPQRFSRRPTGEPARRRSDSQRGKDSRGEAALLLRRKRQRAEDEEIESDSASGLEDTPPTDSESDEGKLSAGRLPLYRPRRLPTLSAAVSIACPASVLWQLHVRILKQQSDVCFLLPICVDGETTDEARFRIARQYLKQFSDAAKGRRGEQGASATGERTDLAADPAFDSVGEESGVAEETGDEESEDDCFQDAETRATVAVHLKRRAEARNVGQ